MTKRIEIVFPESSKKYMELQCNSCVSDYTCCLELKSIEGLLKKICPKNVLELGAGLGRVSAYLRNLLNWGDTKFYLLDGNQGDKQIAGIHSTLQDHFYNSMQATNDFCLANNIKKENLFLVNAAKDYLSIVNNVKFDLCYSFKAIGFHWPIKHYLDAFYNNIEKDALLFFELRSTNKELYTKERLVRIKKFNEDQLNSVDKQKYSIIQCSQKARFPILVLQVKK